ncbi:MAG: tetratricopeptide repeat protein [Chitinispirillales bacterium]|jgi:tol-pal system protein YbgF|nr:tetratricopeptide repeat protein [Chitinispirillales bacterium]
MKKFLTFLAIVCALTAISTGCSRITVLRTQELHAVRDTLRADQTAALAEMETMESRLAAEQAKLLEYQALVAETLRLLRADQLIRFNDIDRKISAIENNLAESHARLTRLDRQTAEVSRRIEQTLAREDEAANQRSLQIEQLFEIAMSDFNAGRYDLAINGFQDLSRQFPESPFAPDAEFWAAESFFAKNDFESAEQLFFEFIRAYPDSPKTCAAFFKLGLAYERQRKIRSRDMVWNNLLTRCPNAVEAQAVRAQMGEQ